MVLDKRTDLKPGTFAVGSPLHQQVSIASGGTLQRVADRFPWLRGAGAQHVNGGWWEAGSALNVPAAAASPLTFVAQLPAADKSRRPEHAVAAAPAAISDLMVALASVGPDEQVYWAQRLVG